MYMLVACLHTQFIVLASVFVFVHLQIVCTYMRTYVRMFTFPISYIRMCIDEFRGLSLLAAAGNADVSQIKKLIISKPDIIHFQHPMTSDTALVSSQHTHAHTHMHIHSHTHARTHAHTHTRTHTHTHTHTHTQTSMYSSIHCMYIVFIPASCCCVGCPEAKGNC